MARASYMYVVIGLSAGERVPVAGFTVKHELIRYVARYSKNWVKSKHWIYRIGDGDPVMKRKTTVDITGEIYRLADELEMEVL